MYCTANFCYSFPIQLKYMCILYTISVLTAVAGINNAVDVGDAVALMDALKNEEAALESVDDALGSRYLSHFIAVKSEKREVCSGVFSFLFLWPSSNKNTNNNNNNNNNNNKNNKNNENNNIYLKLRKYRNVTNISQLFTIQFKY